MFKKILFVVGAIAITASALSQVEVQAPELRRLGAVGEVEGLVTVSDGSTIANVVKDSPVIEGTRYVTSSSGSAVLEMDNGCKIDLKPSQSLVVDGAKNCPALIAAIESLSNSNAVFVALSNPAIALGTLASAALISTARNGGPISGQ
jgi:hypothetical protein